MVTLLHACEDLMDRVRKGVLEYSSQVTDLTLDGLDLVSLMIDQIENTGIPDEETNKLAEEKAITLRKTLGEEIKETQKKEKEESGQDFDFKSIPLEVRKEIVKRLFEGSPVHVVFLFSSGR